MGASNTGVQADTLREAVAIYHEVLKGIAAHRYTLHDAVSQSSDALDRVAKLIATQAMHNTVTEATPTPAPGN